MQQALDCLEKAGESFDTRQHTLTTHHVAIASASRVFVRNGPSLVPENLLYVSSVMQLVIKTIGNTDSPLSSTIPAKFIREYVG